MNYKIIEKENIRYIEVKQAVTCESDVLDIIGICISNDIKLLVLREDVFTEEFINLKSGLAGIVLQKLMNYQIKTSAVIEDKNEIQGRFKELIYELNKTSQFRVFDNIADAESWIINI
ncbi:MAG: DUF4180 domain-containing protein [Peptostreptococcaceae bacterium]